MRPQMQLGWFWVLLLGVLCTAHAHNDTYQLAVKIQELEDRKFATQASFKLPLRSCQAWRYLTDYESSSAIPGVLSAKARGCALICQNSNFPDHRKAFTVRPYN